MAKSRRFRDPGLIQNLRAMAAGHRPRSRRFHRSVKAPLLMKGLGTPERFNLSSSPFTISRSVIRLRDIALLVNIQREE
jgi:hypothetical protein